MSYETTAIFISSHNDFKGFCQIEASFEMGSICYGHVEDLINKAKNKNKTLLTQIEKWEEEHKRCFSGEDYTPELESMAENERQQIIDNLFKQANLLNKNLLHIYHRKDNIAYTDTCGDILILVDLLDFRTAVIKQQANEIYNGEYETGYKRFDMVLKMIDMFRDEQVWGKTPVKVVLWGH